MLSSYYMHHYPTHRQATTHIIAPQSYLQRSINVDVTRTNTEGHVFILSLLHPHVQVCVNLFLLHLEVCHEGTFGEEREQGSSQSEMLGTVQERHVVLGYDVIIIIIIGSGVCKVVECRHLIARARG
jgi:hypothetical protein